MPMFPFVPNLPGVPPLARDATNANIALPGLVSSDGPGLDSQSAQSPSWGIFDAAGNAVIVPDSVVSFEFRAEEAVSDFPVEQGSFSSYNKVQRPFDARMTMNKAGTTQDRTDFLNACQAAKESTDLYTALTPEVGYDNGNVTHYDYRRTSDKGVAMITVEIWLEEIRVAASPTFSNTQQPQGQDPQQDGAVQPQTPTTAQMSQAAGEEADPPF